MDVFPICSTDTSGDQWLAQNFNKTALYRVSPDGCVELSGTSRGAVRNYIHLERARWELPHIKEEPETADMIKDPEIKQEQEESLFHIITVKLEDESSELPPPPTEQDRGKPDGKDRGAGACYSSDPLAQSTSDSEEHTDRSEDYSHENSPSKRSYAMIPPESTVTDHKTFSCSDCGKGFRWSSVLQRHMSVHSGERPHKCSLCEKRFKEKSDLKVHMKTHMAERPYVCLVCEEAFKHKSNLHRHLKHIHHICPVCKTHFSDIITLNSHVRRTHVENGSQLCLKRENMKPHSCFECGMTFQIYSKLQRHMMVHTGEKPFQCAECGRRFNTKSSLIEHLKRVHHICPVCKGQFLSKTELASHLRIHVEEGTLDQSALKRDGSKPCCCPECGKRFKCETDVKRHMSVHTGERPHKCSLCDKAFTQKGSLKMHLRIHTGEKPFVCSVCDKSFAKSFNLKKHLRTHSV